MTLEPQPDNPHNPPDPPPPDGWPDPYEPWR